MPKKTARTSKPGQQRSKEEQWRRRMAAQARVPAGSAVAEPDATVYGDSKAVETGYAPAGEAAAPTAASTSRQRAAGMSGASAARTQATAAAAQRRSASMARSARLRPGANVLSVDEEMRYIKGDIRKLVILTTICIIIIIALSFIVPMIIK